MSARRFVGSGACSGVATLVEIALVAVIALALLPASSGAYIYVSHVYGIDRASSDGGFAAAFISLDSGVEDVVEDVAVDANYVYWSDAAEHAIGRANINGTDIDRRFIADAGSPGSLVVDATHIYWTTGSGISRANLDGTGVATSFVAEAASSVAVDAGGIYWLLEGVVGRANLDGSGVDREFFDLGGPLPTGYTAIAVAGNAVYAVHPVFGWVSRASFDDTGIAKMVGSNIGLNDVAVDAEHVYWSNNSAAAIGRAGRDGSEAESGFVSIRLVAPFGIAVDGRETPDTTIRDVKIAPGRRKAVISFSSSQPDSSFTCALDGTKAKPCESPKTYRRLQRGRHTVKVRATTPAARDRSPAKKRFRL